MAARSGNRRMRWRRGERPSGGVVFAHWRTPALLLVLLCASACHPVRATDADISREQLGEIAMTRQACGSCHRIAGIEGADGTVGPPLDHYARRQMIAGVLPNTPENLARYLKSPRTIVPGNAMPQQRLSDREIQGIVAYLYQQK